jgi:hypothetical protein
VLLIVYQEYYIRFLEILLAKPRFCEENGLMDGMCVRPQMASIPLLLFSLFWGVASQASNGPQQTASTVEAPRTVDRLFRFSIDMPAYAPGRGPVVLVDEAHNNFHTAVGTYLPFAKLLRQDGYVVRRAEEKISARLLHSCGVYVIADAQPPAGKGDPPTFSPEEIESLNRWVAEGGALFVITDHRPDPGAVEDLAASFGIRVSNGYVLNGTLEGEEKPVVFSRRREDRLAEHLITRGRSRAERVEQVATFAGSAFKAGKGFVPILILGPERRSWLPREYWTFTENTPSIPVGGWSQGGVMAFGEGKLAFFSEAAMFTAQVFAQGTIKAGMNSPEAADNARLLLNLMHWLSGIFNENSGALL